MASVALRNRRKHKMRSINENEDEMLVKSLSVPPGLEVLMESLTREVLRMQPQDICLFASEHFAKLVKMRDAAGSGGHPFCKTTIHDKIKNKKNIPSPQTPHPKDDVEIIDPIKTSAAPSLDLRNLTAAIPVQTSDIKLSRSEVSTAEIDKIQNGFFDSELNQNQSDLKEDVADLLNVEEVNVQKQYEDKSQEDVNGAEEVETVDIISEDLEAAKEVINQDVSNIEKVEDEIENNKDITETLEDSKEEIDQEISNIEVEASNILVENNDITENLETTVEEIKNEISNIEAVVDNIEDNVDAQKIEENEVLEANKENIHAEASNIESEIGKVKEEILSEVNVIDNLEETQEVTVEENEDIISNEIIGKDEEINITNDINTGITENEKNSDAKDDEINKPEETEICIETHETSNQKDEEDTTEIIKLVETIIDDIQEKEETLKSEEIDEIIEDIDDIKFVSDTQDDEVEPVDQSITEEQFSTITEIENIEIITDLKDQESSNTTEIEELDKKLSNKEEVEETLDEIQNRQELEIFENLEENINQQQDITNAEKNTNNTQDNIVLVEEKLIDEEKKSEETEEHLSIVEEQPIKLSIPLISTTIATPSVSEEEIDSATSEIEQKVTLAPPPVQDYDEAKLNTSAILIQSIWRGFKIRKLNNKIKDIKEDNVDVNKEENDGSKEHAAAVLIQSLWRGYNLRKTPKVEVIKDSEINENINESTKSTNALDINDTLNEIAAAIKLQSLWRGYKTRKFRNASTSATDNIEPKKNLKNIADEEAKLFLAATTIQSLWRGHSIRKNIKETVTEATPIVEETIEKLESNLPDEHIDQSVVEEIVKETVENLENSLQNSTIELPSEIKDAEEIKDESVVEEIVKETVDMLESGLQENTTNISEEITAEINQTEEIVVEEIVKEAVDILESGVQENITDSLGEVTAEINLAEENKDESVAEEIVKETVDVLESDLEENTTNASENIIAEVNQAEENKDESVVEEIVKEAVDILESGLQENTTDAVGEAIAEINETEEIKDESVAEEIVKETVDMLESGLDENTTNVNEDNTVEINQAEENKDESVEEIVKETVDMLESGLEENKINDDINQMEENKDESVVEENVDILESGLQENLNDAVDEAIAEIKETEENKDEIVVEEIVKEAVDILETNLQENTLNVNEETTDVEINQKTKENDDESVEEIVEAVDILENDLQENTTDAVGEAIAEINETEEINDKSVVAEIIEETVDILESGFEENKINDEINKMEENKDESIVEKEEEKDTKESMLQDNTTDTNVEDITVKETEEIKSEPVVEEIVKESIDILENNPQANTSEAMSEVAVEINVTEENEDKSPTEEIVENTESNPQDEKSNINVETNDTDVIKTEEISLEEIKKESGSDSTLETKEEIEVTIDTKFNEDTEPTEVTEKEEENITTVDKTDVIEEQILEINKIPEETITEEKQEIINAVDAVITEIEVTNKLIEEENKESIEEKSDSNTEETVLKDTADEKDAMDLIKAAVKIQSIWRGFNLRRNKIIADNQKPEELQDEVKVSRNISENNEVNDLLVQNTDKTEIIPEQQLGLNKEEITQTTNEDLSPTDVNKNEDIVNNVNNNQTEDINGQNFKILNEELIVNNEEENIKFEEDIIENNNGSDKVEEEIVVNVEQGFVNSEKEDILNTEEENKASDISDIDDASKIEDKISKDLDLLNVESIPIVTEKHTVNINQQDDTSEIVELTNSDEINDTTESILNHETNDILIITEPEVISTEVRDNLSERKDNIEVDNEAPTITEIVETNNQSDLTEMKNNAEEEPTEYVITEPDDINIDNTDAAREPDDSYLIFEIEDISRNVTPETIDKNIKEQFSEDARSLAYQESEASTIDIKDVEDIASESMDDIKLSEILTSEKAASGTETVQDMLRRTSNNLELFFHESSENLNDSFSYLDDKITDTVTPINDSITDSEEKVKFFLGDGTEIIVTDKQDELSDKQDINLQLDDTSPEIQIKSTLESKEDDDDHKIPVEDKAKIEFNLIGLNGENESENAAADVEIKVENLSENQITSEDNDAMKNEETVKLSVKTEQNVLKKSESDCRIEEILLSPIADDIEEIPAVISSETIMDTSENPISFSLVPEVNSESIVIENNITDENLNTLEEGPVEKTNLINTTEEEISINLNNENLKLENEIVNEEKQEGIDAASAIITEIEVTDKLIVEIKQPNAELLTSNIEEPVISSATTNIEEKSEDNSVEIHTDITDNSKVIKENLSDNKIEENKSTKTKDETEDPSYTEILEHVEDKVSEIDNGNEDSKQIEDSSTEIEDTNSNEKATDDNNEESTEIEESKTETKELDTNTEIFNKSTDVELKDDVDTNDKKEEQQQNVEVDDINDDVTKSDELEIDKNDVNKNEEIVTDITNVDCANYTQDPIDEENDLGKNIENFDKALTDEVTEIVTAAKIEKEEISNKNNSTETNHDFQGDLKEEPKTNKISSEQISTQEENSSKNNKEETSINNEETEPNSSNLKTNTNQGTVEHLEESKEKLAEEETVENLEENKDKPNEITEDTSNKTEDSKLNASTNENIISEETIVPLNKESSLVNETSTNIQEKSTESINNTTDEIMKVETQDDEITKEVEGETENIILATSSDDQDKIELAELQKPTKCDEFPEDRDLTSDEDILSKAATTIQAGARGYLVRKRRNAPQFPDESNSKTIDEPDSISITSQVTVIEKPVKNTTEQITEANIDEENIENQTNTIEDIKQSISYQNIINEAETSGEQKEDNKEDTDEDDEISALNERLRSFSRTNVYHSDSNDEENEEALKYNKSNNDEESIITYKIHENGEKELDAENEEITRILEDKAPISTEPRRSINFDDFDSSKYDLKIDLTTPRSKTASPVQELSTSAYKISAAIADNSIVDAIDNKEAAEEKCIEYIHIPLTGPIPETKLVENARVLSKSKHVDSKESDGDSPEYIYIPLKPPGLEEKVQIHNIPDSTAEDTTNIHTKSMNIEEATENELIEQADDETKLTNIASEKTENEEQDDVDDTEINEEDLAKIQEIKSDVLYLQKLINKSLDLEENGESSSQNNSSFKDKLSDENISESQPHEVKASVDLNEEESNSNKISKESNLSVKTDGEDDESDEIIALNKRLKNLSRTSHESELDLLNLKEDTYKDEIQNDHPEEENKDEENQVEIINTTELQANEVSSTDNASVDENPNETNKQEEKLDDLKIASDKVESEHSSISPILGKNQDKETVKDNKDEEIIGIVEINTRDQVSSTENESDDKNSNKINSQEDKFDDSNISSDKIESKSPILTKTPFVDIETQGEETAEEDNKQIDKINSTEMQAGHVVLAVNESVDENTNKQDNDIKSDKIDLEPTSKSPILSKSPLADIDAFLERNRSRTITRQDPVSDASHRKLFDEIDSIIELYGQKRQMSPTNSSGNDPSELEISKIDSDSEGQHNDVMPNVIMSHSEDTASTNTQIAATKDEEHNINENNNDSSAKKEDSLEKNDSLERKQSVDSGETYVIEKSSPDNISTPEEVSSDEETVKNNAAVKIQTSYRNYRSNLKTIKDEQVHDSLTKLEDKYLDYPEVDSNIADVNREELKDISEITHTKSTVTHNNSSDSNLDSIPEADTPTDLTEKDERNLKVLSTVNNNVPKISGVKNESLTYAKPTEEEILNDSSPENEQLSDVTTPSADSTPKLITSESTYDDSAESSPDVDAGLHNDDAEERVETAGLQHSGEMHDTVDIFLSSEELSQAAGAEMLTSQDDRGNVINNNNNDDVSDVDVNDETTATHAYSDRAPTNRYTTNDVHSDMETEKNEKNNTASTETRASSASPADPMGQDGNDEALAATKIQAGFRGYQVRKQMKTNKNDSDDAKQAKRSSGRRRNSGRRNEASKSSSDLEEKSATKIQAGIRGFLVRKRQRNAKDIKA